MGDQCRSCGAAELAASALLRPLWGTPAECAVRLAISVGVPIAPAADPLVPAGATTVGKVRPSLTDWSLACWVPSPPCRRASPPTSQTHA